MFCKWCGADLPNSAKKCTRCGRDVPAKSDCGGFYDLVPNAKSVSTPGTDSSPKAPEVVPAHAEPVKKDVPAKSKKTGRKGGLHLLITCIGLVLVIVLLLCMGSKLGKVLDAAAENAQSIQALRDELALLRADILGGQTEEIPTPPDGEADLPADNEPAAGDVLLEQQDVTIEISIDRTAEGICVKTTADLGDFNDTVVDHVLFDSDTHSLTGVRIDLSEVENCICVKVDNKMSATGLGSISVDLQADDKVFAQMRDKATYKWEYRIGGTTQWIELDQDVFKVSEANDNTVNYNEADLAGLLKDADTAEFRLTYQRSNEQDGSLTVIISGITVANQPLEINNEQNTTQEDDSNG